MGMDLLARYRGLGQLFFFAIEREGDDCGARRHAMRFLGRRTSIGAGAGESEERETGCRRPWFLVSTERRFGWISFLQRRRTRARGEDCLFGVAHSGA